ncbi:MAG: hypothetical protein L0Y36_00670 [Planctomycetales bacterium]|nr:hypothetical protein [Planctomycetales bacterium]
MNISMGSLKPLTGMAKKYAVLLPSVIITVVALLLFVPMFWLGGKVKGKMEQSARTASSVQSILSDTPSRNQPDETKRYMDKLEEEASRIKTLAVQGSHRDLITYDYGIFPEPNDPSSQIYVEFGWQYRSKIEDLIRQMNAMDAPSDAEIRARTGAARPGGMDYGGYTTARQPGAAKDPMVEALCLTRAKEISTYANHKAFGWYDFWEKYEFSSKDQALQDCWDTQTAFWVYEDVVHTILKLNDASGHVSSSPVKRLLGVSFSGPVVVAAGGAGFGQYYGMMEAGGGTRDIPQYITAVQFGPFMNSSPTGRICNEEVDIVHFAVSVLVDSRHVLTFMKELCSEKPHTFRTDFRKNGQPGESRHNLITILQSDVRVVDKLSADHELYRYGKSAVMQLDLVCEYQFSRSGYDSIKPEPIKKRLAPASGTEGQAAPAPAGGGMPMMPGMPGMPME